jgi:hypothetical protein
MTMQPPLTWLDGVCKQTQGVLYSDCKHIYAVRPQHLLSITCLSRFQSVPVDLLTRDSISLAVDFFFRIQDYASVRLVHVCTLALSHPLSLARF